MQLRVNEPNVVFEAFDEEVILVNLDTGNYYSVRGSGPDIWMAFAGGASIDALTQAIATETQAERDPVRHILTEFAQALVRAELVVPTDARPGPPVSWSGPFDAPQLEIYSDMQDLLMLDPIHDVDAAGWPLAKEQ